MSTAAKMFETNRFSKKSKTTLDPRTKIIILLSCTIGVLYSSNLYVLVCLLSLSILLMIISKPSLKMVFFTLFFLSIFSSITTIIIYYTSSSINPYLLFLIVECRFVTTFALFIWFLRTVEPYELAVTFEKMFVPAKLTWFITMMYQFIPTVMKEANEINEIRKLKGLTAKKWQLKRQFYNMRKTLKPLITGSINRGIDLAESVVLKGFKPRRRKFYVYNIRIRIIDIFVVIVSITGVVLITVYLKI